MSVSVISVFGLLILVAALAVFGVGAMMLLVWMARLFRTQDSASDRKCDSEVREFPSAAHRSTNWASATARPVAIIGFLFIPAVLAGILWISTDGPSNVHVTHIVDHEPNTIETGLNQKRVSSFGSLNSAFRSLQQAKEELAEAVRTSREAAAAVGSPERSAASQSDIVLLRLSPQTLAQIAGTKDSEMISKLAEGLPELRDQIRGTYALIPLYAPGSPLSPASRPVATMEGLRKLVSALSTVVVVNPEASAHVQSVGANTATRQKDAEVSAAVEVRTETEPLSAGDTAEMAEAPESVVTNAAKRIPPMPKPPGEPRLTPTWLRNPEGGRRVVETSFVPASDQSPTALNEAVSRALQDHLAEQTDQVLKPGTEWNRLIHLSLSEDTVATCVVDTFEQEEVIRTSEGLIPMRKTFALVEFPETVDNAAMAVIRESVQQQRIGVVGVVLGIFWAAALITGLMIRLATGGSRWRKALAFCGLLIIPLPMILCSIGFAITAFRGATFDFPWQSSDETVVINIPG